jgi:hypothetical protein
MYGLEGGSRNRADPYLTVCLPYLWRSVKYEEVLERVRDYYPTEAYKKAYRKRTVWVEPLFAEGKDWHGMRRFRLRLLWRVNSEALMRAAGQNLKRLLKKRGWGRRSYPAEAVCASFLVMLTWLTHPFWERRSCSSPISSVISLPLKQAVPLY